MSQGAGPCATAAAWPTWSSEGILCSSLWLKHWNLSLSRLRVDLRYHLHDFWGQHRSMCTHSIDDLLPHAPLHCAATGEMVKCSWYVIQNKNTKVPSKCVDVRWEIYEGSLYSVDWTTGLDYWTGILASPLTPKIAYKRLHLTTYSLVGWVGL